jgi:hypothetical protein
MDVSTSDVYDMSIVNRPRHFCDPSNITLQCIMGYRTRTIGMAKKKRYQPIETKITVMFKLAPMNKRTLNQYDSNFTLARN